MKKSTADTNTRLAKSRFEAFLVKSWRLYKCDDTLLKSPGLCYKSLKSLLAPQDQNGSSRILSKK